MFIITLHLFLNVRLLEIILADYIYIYLYSFLNENEYLKKVYN